MPLTVTSVPMSTRYNQLLIFNGRTQIGEYERSQKADIARKKQELLNAEKDLLRILHSHGPFVVRWSKGAKEVRNSQGVKVGVIARRHWERPSWQE